MWGKLTTEATILTRGRTLISGAETEVATPRLSVVCSITKKSILKEAMCEAERSH